MFGQTKANYKNKMLKRKYTFISYVYEDTSRNYLPYLRALYNSEYWIFYISQIVKIVKMFYEFVILLSDIATVDCPNNHDTLQFRASDVAIYND